VRGPSVFAGYWDDAEATRSVFSDDGWLRTGDLAVADDEGRLHLVDRLKDMIIVSGFNVFPAEVEAILTEHPAVAMAAVVGHPDPATGETVVAHVVLATGAAAEEDDIIDFCCSQMARYKAPTKVVFDDHLPIGASGKVTRRALRA
jgi:long-chain acyl-CoA synthetase